jgi:hypothetical protein
MNIIKEQRRSTRRAQTNPMDVSTIFSIYNKKIAPEIKPTLQPGVFHLPQGTPEEPGRILIEPSSWWREIDLEQPLLEIPVGSLVVAESVVKDYAGSLLGCVMPDRMPGLFYIPGNVSVAELKDKYKSALIKAIVAQNNWYDELIRIADIGWARSNGNPLVISDDMRMAANERHKLNKGWMVESNSVELIPCVACGQLRNPLYPICQHCKNVVDPDKAKTLGLKFAV